MFGDRTKKAAKVKEGMPVRKVLAWLGEPDDKAVVIDPEEDSSPADMFFASLDFKGAIYPQQWIYHGLGRNGGTLFITVFRDKVTNVE